MEIMHVNLAKDIAGGELQMLELMKALHQLGINQSVVVRKNKKLDKFFNKNFKGMKKIKSTHIFSNLFSREIRKFDGIIHAHDAKAVHWAANKKLFWGKPFLVTRRVNRLIKHSSVKAYLNASKLVAISSSVKKTLQCVLGDVPIAVISSSPRNFDAFERIKVPEIKLMNKKFIVLQVGKFFEYKGYYYSLKAAQALEKKHPDILFVFLGDGILLNELKIKFNHLKNVLFLGFKSNVADYLRIANIFIMPSTEEEGLGSAALDALQFKLPVIASNACGVVDVIRHQVDGLLIPQRNSLALTNSIVKLYEDENLCARLGESGYKRVEDFNISKMAKKYIEVYKNILDGCAIV